MSILFPFNLIIFSIFTLRVSCMIKFSYSHGYFQLCFVWIFSTPLVSNLITIRTISATNSKFRSWILEKPASPIKLHLLTASQLILASSLNCAANQLHYHIVKYVEYFKKQSTQFSQPTSILKF